MTKVRFTFVDIQGNPLKLMEFKLQVRRASFNDEDTGVTLPEEITVTTDNNGQAIVELWPLKTAYRITIDEEYEDVCGKLNWQFYVPHVDEIIDAQELFLVPPPRNLPWDEEAIGRLTQAVQDARDAEKGAQTAEVNAKASEGAAKGSADNAASSAAAAKASQTAAKTSETNSKTSETNALASKNAAAVSAGNAASSASAAKTSENAAKASQDAAKVSETNAGVSASDAAASASAGAGSAAAAKVSQDAAKVSENNANTSKNAAATSATNAKTSETNAAASATAAAGSAGAAKTSETNAAGSAGAAKTSETNAKSSETAAAGSASAAAGSASAANTSETNASGSATAAQTARTGAETARTGAETARTQAQTAATNSANSASAAKASQDAAKVSETNAAKSAADAAQAVGARLTSIAQAVMAVNDMLIADSATTMKSIATGAAGRTILGATSPADVRNYLALGTSSVRDVITSIYDQGVANLGDLIMRVGAFGLGATDLYDIPSTTDIDTLNATGFYQITGASPNSPSGLSGQMIVMTNATYYTTQIFSPQDSTGRLYIRSSVRNGSTTSRIYSPWTELANRDHIKAALKAVGLGTDGSSRVTDANAVTESGFYNTPSTAANIPQATNSTLEHYSWNDGSGAVQRWTAISGTSPNVWVRVKGGSVWFPWMLQTNSNHLKDAIAATGWGVTGYMSYMTGSVDDYTRANGLYSVSAANEGVKPAGQNYGMLEVMGRNNIAGSGSRVVQIWHATDGADPSQMWIRHVSTTTPWAWTAWREMAGVDTVTQAINNVGLGLTNAAQAIPGNADLNSYQTTGFYGQSQNAQASNGLNYPVPKAGSLLVQNGGSAITSQMYVEYDTGTVWTRSRYNSSWSTWSLQWDSALLVKTENTMDTTIGRITRVGDFGLGVLGIPPTINNCDSFLNPTGFYRTAGGSGTFPAGASKYGTLLIESYSGDYTKQTYTPNQDGAKGGTLWTRVSNSKLTTPIWTEWKKQLTNDDTTAWGINENIGNTSGTAFCANVDNFDLPNGLYVADSGTTGTKPPGQSWGTVIVTGRNWTAGRIVQTWNNTENYNGRTIVRTWRRLNYGRVWGAWIQDLSYDDLATESLTFEKEVTIKSTNVLRLKNDSSTTTPAVIVRVDTGAMYFLVTDPDAQNGSFNSLRPLMMNLTTGMFAFNHGITVGAPSRGDSSSRAPTTGWVNDALTVKEDNISAGNTSQFWRGDKTWQDFGTMTRGQALTGLNAGATGVIQATDNILTAFGKTQKQINDLSSSKEANLPSGGTSAHFLRGDKTWQDFNGNVRGAVLTGLSVATNAALAATDSIISAFGKLQAQINAIIGDNTNITSLRASKYLDPLVVANASGTYSLNLASSTTFELTLTGNTTLAMTNVPSLPANTLLTVLVTVKQGGTVRTLTLPSGTVNITLGGAAIPTPGANKQTDYIFTLKAGASNWEVRQGAAT